MSIEIDPPLQLEHCSQQYYVYLSINEEFHEQIDFVRIVRLRDRKELCCITPTQAKNELQTQAVELAQANINQLELDNGLVIDDFDIGDSDGYPH